VEKRYQVFALRTMISAKNVRRLFKRSWNLIVFRLAWKLFPAGDDEQWKVIKRVIDECDYYVVIIAGRYGSVGPGGKSYTQMEYEYAAEKGKPVMAFLHEQPGNIPADKTEPDPNRKMALNQFRELAKQKMCKFWNSPAHLGGVVSRAVAKMKQSRPAVGWVRANLVADESAAQEILRLKNENDELNKLLDVARSTPPKGSEGLAQEDENTELTTLAILKAALRFKNNPIQPVGTNCSPF
jgi:hypothetical protein